MADTAETRDTMDSSRSWIAVVILLVFYILSMLDRGIIALLVFPIKQDLMVTDIQIGLLQGFAFALLYGIVGVPIGLMVDRFDRRWLLYAGIILWSVGTAACGFATDFTSLFIARMSVGCGEAVLLPISVSFLGELFSRERRGTATGVFTTGSAFGTGLALGGGGILITYFDQIGGLTLPWLGVLSSWRSTFLVCGIIGIVLAPLSFAIPDRRARTSLPAIDASAILPTGVFAFMRKRWQVTLHLFVGFPLMGAVMYGYASWGPAHLIKAYGWEPRTVGLLVGIIQAVGTSITLILGGWLMDRAYHKGIKGSHFLIPALAAAVGGPLIAAAFAVDAPALTIVCLVLGLPIFCLYGAGNFAALQLFVPADKRGRVAALYVLAQALITNGLGPLMPAIASTQLPESSHQTGYGLAIVVVLLTPAIVIIMLNGRKYLTAAIEAERKST